MQYMIPNQTGLRNLTEWLCGRLINPDHAERYAAALIDDCQGVEPGGADLIVELRAMHSKNGTPQTYRFSADELELISIDDDLA